jgi:hypothetical protein
MNDAGAEAPGWLELWRLGLYPLLIDYLPDRAPEVKMSRRPFVR